MRAPATLLRGLVPAGLLGLLGCVGHVGDTGGGDLSAFERDVVPVIERDCGTDSCHAAPGDRFDSLDPSYFVFPVDDEGKISGHDRIERAYERAREKLSGAGAEFSDLVRKPLDVSLGGLAHRGGSQFRTMDDPSLVALMRWAQAARPSEETALTPLEQRFADEIQPVLAEKRCMLSSCHGASASNLLKFDPGVLGRFDNIATKRNYASFNLHLNLETPDPMLSRALRKTIPPAQGGIFHRGGNAFFDVDADAELLARFTSFVTDARDQLGVADTGKMTGIVFAATDPTPRKLFDIGTWQPGGDLYALIPPEPGGTLTNLTATLHGDPADIRDPAVSYDGKRVAFAMRRNQDDCLNLYILDLDTAALTQVTHDTGVLANGIKVANVEPLWGPDDRIYFVSTRPGVISAQGTVPQANLYRIDPDGQNLLRMTYSAGVELAPQWRLFPAKGALGPEDRTLDLTFTATRKVGADLFAPLMRVPPDFRSDYHPHYGTQNPRYQIFTQISQLPDLREPLLLMDDSTVWEGGALALIDRNLGPVISDGLDPSVVNYVEPLQKLGTIGEDVRHRGYSPGGYYRDPHAAPDGSLLVVYSPAPIDLSDPNAAPDPALYRVQIADLPGNQSYLSSRDLLVDVPGKVEMDPRPIYRRRREEIGDAGEHLRNDVDWGDMLNFDLSVALTIARQDSPSGVKSFDQMADDIRYVRLVEEVPGTAADGVGRGGHGIRRILAEVPATRDRSLYLRLPAGVPFYIQALDDSGAATATFNEWFSVLPGEKLTQVTRREVWNTRCGACHGSVTGQAGDTVATPDVLTQASRVEANYDATTRTDLPPVEEGLDPTGRPEIDFERDVQPILTARCATAGCHAAGARTPDLSARAGTAGFSGAYEALTASGGDSGHGFAYVDPASSSARTSYLAEVLMGKDLDAPRGFDSGGCGAGDDITLSELKTLMRWMDLGAAYVGVGPKTRPELPTY